MVLQIQSIKTLGNGGESKVSASFKIYLKQHAVYQKQYNHFYNDFVRL